MKKIFLIIGMATVMSNAGCGYICNQHLERIANALERIATVMEKQQVQAQKEATPKKLEITHLNGRSLKAVPTNDVFIEEDFDEKTTEDCVEKCWNKPLNNQIKSCIDKCIKEITK